MAKLPQDHNAEYVQQLLKPKAEGEPTEAPAEEPRQPATPGTPSGTDPQRRTEVPNAADRQALQRAIDATRPTTPAPTRP